MGLQISRDPLRNKTFSTGNFVPEEMFSKYKEIWIIIYAILNEYSSLEKIDLFTQLFGVNKIFVDFQNVITNFF